MDEIEERAQRIRLALAGVNAQESAEICLLARVVQVNDNDLKVLSKFKLLQDLAKEKPDPRNLKLASEIGAEDSAKAFTGGLSVKITSYTTPDKSLALIIADCPERPLEEMTEALALRIKKLDAKVYPTILEACRNLYHSLDDKYGGPRRAKERLEALRAEARRPRGD